MSTAVAGEVKRQPLSAPELERQLRERDRRGEASCTAVARHVVRDQALHDRNRYLGMEWRWTA